MMKRPGLLFRQRQHTTRMPGIDRPQENAIPFRAETKKHLCAYFHPFAQPLLILTSEGFRKFPF